MTPKAYISYSWSSLGHKERVREWAERLIDDGIEVILDVYDLKEGQDKYAFMERMVTDQTVTHILIFSDKKYARKADERKAGVGTESQIISKEVYEKVEQSKFIPIVCEFSDDGEPCLPAFLKSRIWINFSTPEAVNDNWEQLVRCLFGKPAHEKPQLGKPPAYIREEGNSPASPIIAKFSSLKQAILQEKRGIKIYRGDFLDACIKYADTFRVREQPKVDSLGEMILDDCRKLIPVRDYIVDWVILESESTPPEEFSDILTNFLERLAELKSRPPEVHAWNDAWYDALSVFVYETFLYIIAVLLRTNSFDVLHELLTATYLIPKSQVFTDKRFTFFDIFGGHSDVLNEVLAPEGVRLSSPAAELIKRQATRDDVRFENIIEAELLILLMSFLNPNTLWYPQTLYYSGYMQDFPFFVKASQHKHFMKLAKITGIDSGDKLREEVKQGCERLNASGWIRLRMGLSYLTALNIEKLDTIK